MLSKDSYKIILASALLGLIAGIGFIFVQPLFGMSPLTLRHAENYMKLSTMSEGTALSLAWFIHLSVSACYGLATGIAFILSKKASTGWLVPLTIQTLLLGWFTTLIAPPANAFIVKFVGLGLIPALDTLPQLNYSIDAKFILHILFFSVIAVTLSIYSKFKTNEVGHYVLS